MRTNFFCLIRWQHLAILSVNAISQVPKAKFSIQSVSGTDNFVFTDESEGSPTSYNWSFPGGHPGYHTGTGSLDNYNLNGILVKSGDFINNKADLSSLKSGVYLITINNSTKAFRIIKN